MCQIGHIRLQASTGKTTLTGSPVARLGSQVPTKRAAVSDSAAPKLATLAKQVKHRGKAVLAKNWVKQDSLDAQEIIIEYCCGQNSAIGKYTTSSLVVRFTAEDDLTKKETLATVKAVAEANPKASVLLWVAIPCTGGSSLQNINRARGMDPDRLRAHLKLFRKLWSDLRRLVDGFGHQEGK